MIYQIITEVNMEMLVLDICRKEQGNNRLYFRQYCILEHGGKRCILCVVILSALNTKYQVCLFIRINPRKIHQMSCYKFSLKQAGR